MKSRINEALDQFDELERTEVERHPGECEKAHGFGGIPMRIVCPDCGGLHLDEGEWQHKPHHTHACQECGNVWRPAIENTTGVRFLPGFRNEVE